MKKSNNDNQIQVREVDVTVDGKLFVVYFMDCDNSNDQLTFKIHFYATDESVQLNFVSIFKKMMKYRGPIGVELCIGDFKKNVIVIGTSAHNKFYWEGAGEELENHKKIVHCTLYFTLDEDDCNYLIDKYYPERTRPSYESMMEKYGDLAEGFRDDEPI